MERNCPTSSRDKECIVGRRIPDRRILYQHGQRKRLQESDIELHQEAGKTGRYKTTEVIQSV